MSEASILERVLAAAAERRLAGPTLAAYRHLGVTPPNGGAGLLGAGDLFTGR